MSESEIKNTVKSIILKELRHQRISTDGLWRFQQHNVFKHSLDQPYKDVFDLVLAGLVEEQILSRYGMHYRLTEKGYQAIYKDILD